MKQSERSLACSKVKRKSPSCVRLLGTPWTIQSMEFSRPEHRSGQPFPSPGDLPNPGIEPRSPALQAILYQLSHKGSPHSKHWIQRYSEGHAWGSNQLILCPRTQQDCLRGGTLPTAGSRRSPRVSKRCKRLPLQNGPPASVVHLGQVPRGLRVAE